MRKSPPAIRNLRRTLRLRLRQLHRNRTGGTALEFTLLLAAFVVPSYLLIRFGLAILIAHYQMITDLNALPIP